MLDSNRGAHGDHLFHFLRQKKQLYFLASALRGLFR